MIISTTMFAATVILLLVLSLWAVWVTYLIYVAYTSESLELVAKDVDWLIKILRNRRVIPRQWHSDGDGIFLSALDKQHKDLLDFLNLHVEVIPGKPERKVLQRRAPLKSHKKKTVKKSTKIG